MAHDDESFGEGITRFPCPACGSMMTEENLCTNMACETRPENAPNA